MNAPLREQIENEKKLRGLAYADLAEWRSAALLKVRTRRTIVGRVAAGESIENVAVDYKVPAEFVRLISKPGYDILSGEPDVREIAEAVRQTMEERRSDPALIQPSESCPSCGSAPPSSSLPRERTTQDDETNDDATRIGQLGEGPAPQHAPTNKKG